MIVPSHAERRKSKRLRSSGAEAERTLLLEVTPAFQGSTALFMLLASSHAVAHLCGAQTWQCEGQKLMNSSGLSLGGSSLVPLDGEDNWNYHDMLHMYAPFWNLSKPVLLDKSTTTFTRIHQGKIVQSLLNLSMNVPQQFAEAGISRLKIAYIMMWQPPCLSKLSSHDLDPAVRRQQLRALMLDHQLLTKKKQPVLLFSYGSLLWAPRRIAAAVQAFLPELGQVDPSADPESVEGLTGANLFKVQGSILEFGRQKLGCCGYNIQEQRCEYDALAEDDEEEEEELSYLRKHSVL